jgi:hypothetical protein
LSGGENNMSNRNKYITAIFLVVVAAITFLLYTYQNKFDIHELISTISINIEVDKQYTSNYSVIAEPNSRTFVIHYGKLDSVARFAMFMVLINFAYNFRVFGGSSNDVYKEAQEYISADIAAHSLKAAELNDREPSYYFCVFVDG